MTPPLHTGVHSETVVTDWSLRQTRCRMVLTNPWALPRARRVLRAHLLGLDQALALRPRRSLLGRLRHDRWRPEVAALLKDVLGEHPTGRVGRFPYGLVAAPADASPHRPRRETWELAVETAALSDRVGLQLDPGTTPRAWSAQRCAEAIAEATYCGVLIALGGDVATSGLAPIGGWHVAVDDPVFERDDTAVVTIDGGAVSTLTTVGEHGAPDRPELRPVVAPLTGRVVEPVWRSVTVIAADATAANAACVAALVRGRDAVTWLDRTGLPARLVSVDGTVVTAGGWPVG